MTPTYDIQRIAAFADGDQGGNPAGVVIADALPSDADMQRIAAEVGYSETAFAAREGDHWRVRYFAPASEVAFCGHATIALGSALAAAHGEGAYPLRINGGAISVASRVGAAGPEIALTSPPTRSGPPDPALLAAALALFGLTESELASDLPPGLANAGNDHLVLALKSRKRLATIDYDLETGAALMRDWGLTTINLLVAETPRFFHSRNAFAIGGVLEDPATGAAAAALAGYLRDRGWPHGGRIEILQGEDMGAPSRLTVEIGGQPGAPVQVSGTVRAL